MAVRRHLTGKQPAQFNIYVAMPDEEEARLTFYIKGNHTVLSLKNMIEQHVAIDGMERDHQLMMTYRVAGMLYNTTPSLCRRV